MTHRIHGTGTYIDLLVHENHKFKVNVGIHIPVLWILWVRDHSMPPVFFGGGCWNITLGIVRGSRHFFSKSERARQ